MIVMPQTISSRSITVCSPGLSEGEQNQFYQLLLSYSDIFADTGSDVGCTNKLKHTIFTGDIQPIH